MFSRPPRLVIVPAILAFFATSAFAQQQRAGRPGDNSKPLPLEGKLLPKVSAFNAKGETVDLRKALKGKHGVIVFGCLT